jgi:hypothetical protein
MTELAQLRARVDLVDRAAARTEATVEEIKITMGEVKALIRDVRDMISTRVDSIEDRMRKAEVDQAKAAGSAAVKRTLLGTGAGLVGGLLAGLGTFFFTGHH